jgi:uridylate kinase
MGGSLLVPDHIDVDFIIKLKEMLVETTQLGYQVVIAVGGGKTSRNYHQAAAHFPHITDTDADWIGIAAIKLNAQLLLRIFSDCDVHPKVVSHPDDIQPFKESIVFVAAWEPGHSSDANAVFLADTLGAQKIINFSNISHVYDKDPAQYPDAQKISALTWDEYLTLIPETWSANLSSPFDPVASRFAQEKGIHVHILGASIDNLRASLSGDESEGTVIS